VVSAVASVSTRSAGVTFASALGKRMLCRWSAKAWSSVASEWRDFQLLMEWATFLTAGTLVCFSSSACDAHRSYTSRAFEASARDIVRR
jgi:hypothetical protein